MGLLCDALQRLHAWLSRLCQLAAFHSTFDKTVKTVLRALATLAVLMLARNAQATQSNYEKLKDYHRLMHDTMAKAKQLHAEGKLAAAISHWNFAANQVAIPALHLIVQPDGPGGNVAFWRKQILAMQREAWARANCNGDLPVNKQALPSASQEVTTCSSDHPSTPRVARSNLRLNPGKAAARKQREADTRSDVASAIMVLKPDVGWDDVIGLEAVKAALQEAVVLPSLRADLFQGIRAPVRGLLLYGPPGTGKTLVAKAVAAAMSATFFAVSAATVTSQWFGGSEKLMRELFTTARQRQPSVIFMDEIDALLGSRSTSEHDASRRLKTEFLVQFDGVATNSDSVLVLAATNRPQDLDDAVVRRLPRRIYVPLPDANARIAMAKHMLRSIKCAMTGADFAALGKLTDMYSGSDLKALCHEAAMRPLRDHGRDIATVPASKLRAVTLGDFQAALASVRPSVSASTISSYKSWTRDYGSLE